jgi:hypothetical protein
VLLFATNFRLIMNNTEQQYNKAVYFMLPLLKLNSNSFGENNFINAYITKTQQIVVEIIDKDVVEWKYWEHQNYAIDFDIDNKTTIIFNLPSIFNNDYKKFIEGKYSEFDMLTKDIIKKHSGLPYMNGTGRYVQAVDETGNKIVINGEPKMVELKSSSKYLLALDKDENLRKNLETTLDVVIPVGSELLDKPKEEEIIKL